MDAHLWQEGQGSEHGSDRVAHVIHPYCTACSHHRAVRQCYLEISCNQADVRSCFGERSACRRSHQTYAAAPCVQCDLQKQPEGHPVLLTFFDSSAAFSTRPQEIFCCVEVMIEANPPNDIKGLAL